MRLVLYKLIQTDRMIDFGKRVEETDWHAGKFPCQFNVKIILKAKMNLEIFASAPKLCIDPFFFLNMVQTKTPDSKMTQSWGTSIHI